MVIRILSNEFPYQIAFSREFDRRLLMILMTKFGDRDLNDASPTEEIRNTLNCNLASKSASQSTLLGMSK